MERSSSDETTSGKGCVIRKMALSDTKQGGSNPFRPTKSTQAAIERRRMEVLHYYIRGLNVDEMIQSMKSPPSRRTLYRDIAWLETWIKEEYAKQRAYTVARAMLEIDEMWRELWRIFHDPTAGTDERTTKRLSCLDRLMKLNQMKSVLFGLYDVELKNQIDAIEREFRESKATIEAAIRDVIMDRSKPSPTADSVQPPQRPSGVDEKMPDSEGKAIQPSGEALPSSDLPGKAQKNRGESPPARDDRENR